MRTRPLIPGGQGGLLLLAVAAVPIVLNRCKPLAKKVGEKMVEWGEKIQNEANRPNSSVDSEKSSNADMNKSTPNETLEAASPAGKEEVKEQIAAQTVKKKSPPKPKAATETKKKVEPKTGTAGTTTNPKKPTKKPE